MTDKEPKRQVTFDSCSCLDKTIAATMKTELLLGMMWDYHNIVSSKQINNLSIKISAVGIWQKPKDTRFSQTQRASIKRLI